MDLSRPGDPFDFELPLRVQHLHSLGHIGLKRGHSFQALVQLILGVHDIDGFDFPGLLLTAAYAAVFLEATIH